MPRGPKPKPVEVKRQEGNGKRDAGKRAIPTDTPTANGARPTKPPIIAATKSASAAWDRICDDLESMGTLSSTDRTALANLAQLVGTMEDAYAKLVADGEDGEIATVVEYANGQEGPHPAHTIYNRAASLARPLFAEFALTPSARSRVKLPKPDDDPADFNELGGGR